MNALASEVIKNFRQNMVSEPRKHGQRFLGLIKAYKRIMSFSQSVRKVAVCWCSIVAIPAVVYSQNSFVPSGGEYSVVGKLPGDQVYPGLNFTTNGGYIVWQDNWIDGNGLGVGAMRLNPDLTTTGNSIFPVNSLKADNQQNGHVSMLNNGGAAFAWQGGSHGLQHIYSRFLSPSNSWLTGDVLVNSVTNRYQSSPVIATLLNGNVVMAYSSANQASAGSMADVYFQMFTPQGNKVGSETLVNQFTPNNQRSPAIAALANGSFAIAWISEQERWTDASNGVPSVDVYARVFNSDGTPSSPNEFLVNVSTNICAGPDLAAAPDGGFMAVWMEKDMVVPANGWDIYCRRFSSSGVGGNVSRLNTQLYGDQYSPRINRAGTTYLAVWTSIDQDGSKEGVFGTYVNDDGTTSGNEFQVNTTTLGSQMHQAVGADGSGRFLVAWTGFTGGIAYGFDLFAQQYLNPSVAVTNGGSSGIFSTDPNANPNSVSNSPPVAQPGLPPTPPENPSSNPAITNTFNDVKGVYNGLVYDANDVSAADSGYITVATTASGGFTAKLQIAGKNYSFSGQFSASGTNVTQVGPWTVNLQLDLHGGYNISGQVSNGNLSASVLAYLAVYGKAKQAPLAGNYTMVVQAGNDTIGNGIGTVSVDTLGNVNCSVTLPDGTRLNEKTTLSQSGAWPLYGTLYKNGGVLIGWMQFTGAASDGFGGQSVWTKPSGMAAPYSGGLTNASTILGSQYKAPPMGYRSFGKSQLVLNGGGLSTPITNSVTWGYDNKVINLSANKLSVSLSTTTGLFKGTVVDPATKKSVSFQGVLYERGNVGLGFFPGANQSGGVNFAPNP
jgi:hypothetical protein